MYLVFICGKPAHINDTPKTLNKNNNVTKPQGNKLSKPTKELQVKTKQTIQNKASQPHKPLQNQQKAHQNNHFKATNVQNKPKIPIPSRPSPKPSQINNDIEKLSTENNDQENLLSALVLDAIETVQNLYSTLDFLLRNDESNKKKLSEMHKDFQKKIEQIKSKSQTEIQKEDVQELIDNLKYFSSEITSFVLEISDNKPMDLKNKISDEEIKKLEQRINEIDAKISKEIPEIKEEENLAINSDQINEIESKLKEFNVILQHQDKQIKELQVKIEKQREMQIKNSEDIIKRVTDMQDRINKFKTLFEDQINCVKKEIQILSKGINKHEIQHLIDRIKVLESFQVNISALEILNEDFFRELRESISKIFEIIKKLENKDGRGI